MSRAPSPASVGVEAVAKATKAIIDAFAAFLRRRLQDDLVWLRDTVVQSRPGAVTADELDAIARDEAKLEAEFQRKALERWRTVVPRILSIPNPQFARAAEAATVVRQITDRGAIFASAAERLDPTTHVGKAMLGIML